MQPSPMRKIGWVISILVIVAIVVSIVIGVSKSKPAVVPVAPVVVANPRHLVIGKSVQGRDIDAYVYSTSSTTIESSTDLKEGGQSSPSEIRDSSGNIIERRLLFVGGIHGGYEWNSVSLAYAFMDYLEMNPGFIPKGFTITVIPSVNPDGVYAVTGREGRSGMSDVSTSTKVLAKGRFNADAVDLNRNFDCKWQPKSTWQQKTVSAGKTAFSEPETKALRDYISTFKPDAAIFWHSQSNAVYASQCEKGILPTTLNLMNAYSKDSGYPAVKTFTAYTTTGAADDWLASIGIPAITVELKTHEAIEWDRNLKGIQAVFQYFSGGK